MTEFSLKNFEDQNIIPKESFDQIVSRLPEYERGSLLIGHSTSQTGYSLQTMTMISDSPLSRMKQCLAQIEKRMNALREAYFKNEKIKLELKKLKENNINEFTDLEIRKKEAMLEQTTKSMIHAFRQIGHFQDLYDSIKKNNNIPDDWTEVDFEKQEIENMIKRSFRLGIQEITQTGRIGKSSVEFWEQLGIHPQLAEYKVREYLDNMANKIRKGENISINLMYEFLDKMCEIFYNEHKNAVIRMGLDSVTSEKFMASGDTKPTT